MGMDGEWTGTVTTRSVSFVNQRLSTCQPNDRKSCRLSPLRQRKTPREEHELLFGTQTSRAVTAAVRHEMEETAFASSCIIQIKPVQLDKIPFNFII